MLRSNSEQSGETMWSVLKKKRKAAVGRRTFSVIDKSPSVYIRICEAAHRAGPSPCDVL